ncbi:hypothetical protein GCM10025787_00510 [Saccharopolyspora rosea]|uniref:Uncharacterized protein n=1 Tax=Saccharopolyspora rosea TaxID=524884 RepID=A0ABW3FRB2_9PSEU
MEDVRSVPTRARPRTGPGEAEPLSAVELDRQRVEFLPPRTLLTIFAVQHGGPIIIGGDGGNGGGQGGGNGGGDGGIGANGGDGGDGIGGSGIGGNGVGGPGGPVFG